MQNIMDAFEAWIHLITLNIVLREQIVNAEAAAYKTRSTWIYPQLNLFVYRIS